MTGLYVHVPFCERKCGYCGFYSEQRSGWDLGRFIQSLFRELDTYDIYGRIDTVYIGGGSPSCLGEKYLSYLLDGVAGRAGIKGEFTVEVNPDQLTGDLLDVMSKAGVNRLSMGAQSFNQSELDLLGRGCQVQTIKEAVSMARRNGFDNINIDLIFAIPGSTLQTWQYTLGQAIDLAVEHIAAYSLSYEKNTPFSRKRDMGEIEPVGDDDDRLMYEMACDMLAEASLGQYEISNFAKENYQCQHNLIYWSNEPYIGIGPAAGSYWDGCRKLNVADVGRYMAAMEQGETVIAESEKPSPDEITCQTAILMLRRTRGIDFLEFEQRTGRSAMKLFAQTIERYCRMGLLVTNGSSVRLTPEGMAVADSVMCDFSEI